MPIKWLEIGWGGSKIQELKFDSIFLTDESHVDKKNSIWGRKIQNQMFMNSIKFYWRFNWIYGGFDYKKKMFLSQFGFYWEEIKVQGSNYNLSRNLITKFQNLSDQTENGHFTSQNNSLFITFFITLGKPF
jgi:hypothetical protein